MFSILALIFLFQMGLMCKAKEASSADKKKILKGKPFFKVVTWEHFWDTIVQNELV